MSIPHNIEDLVEDWHNGDSTKSLPEYIGISEQEYSDWVELKIYNTDYLKIALEDAQAALNTHNYGSLTDNLPCLLTNLRHFCNANGVNFERALRVSETDFNNEVRGING